MKSLLSQMEDKYGIPGETERFLNTWRNDLGRW